MQESRQFPAYNQKESGLKVYKNTSFLLCHSSRHKNQAFVNTWIDLPTGCINIEMTAGPQPVTSLTCAQKSYLALTYHSYTPLYFQLTCILITFI